MRNYIGVVFLGLLITIYGTAPAQTTDKSAPSAAQARSAQRQNASTDEIEQYLIASAATDFHDHGPAGPLRFRNVRFGHTTAGGKDGYKLCGEFRQTEKGDKAEWMHFVTIKTSGYEQYLGGQGMSYCKDLKSDSKDDLSAMLQKQFDSLQSDKSANTK